MAAETGPSHRGLAASADFYVAPGGKDTHPGTAAAPFATLARARDAVREKAATGLTGDLLVLIHGGTYPQTNPLVFGPEDSGTEKYSVTYAACLGEKVVISGGRKITGWKQGAGEFWTTELSEVKAGQWAFRQLFVNGKRAIRARTPNVDDPIPWWKIRTSTAKYEEENLPITVSVTGPIRAYTHPDKVELVYIANNEGGRKRLGSLSEPDQTFTLAPPHRWNPKSFGFDWYLSFPSAGKACYLENAPEMLDQAGEWYLDLKTGILAYWPRAGEDLNRAEVVAPVVQKTLLAVLGTRTRPVVNLHFKGLHVEHVDWPLPAWGYMGLFCCNLAEGKDPKPAHRWMEAAVEFEYARRCNFVDGGIARVGGLGLCLRNGTAFNVIEGNAISDLGGGGIGAGGCNVAGGFLYAAPPPDPNEFKGYRIANNHVHHCGTDYYGAVGIGLYLSQGAVLAHNLVHDTAYFGMCVAGSQDPQAPFARNNTVEYNHIYNAMKVTVDGSGLYVTFAQSDQGALIRGNLIHDVQNNPFGNRGDGDIPCHGLYLDGNSSGCHYTHNVVYRNAGGPLLFNSKKQYNTWLDNLFQKDGTPPPEWIEVLQSYAGLEPAYRKSILKTEPNPCQYYSLTEPPSAQTRWSACQYDLPQKGRGVIAIFCRAEHDGDSAHLKLRGLDPAGQYAMKGYDGAWSPADESFYSGTLAANNDGQRKRNENYLAVLGDLPILSQVGPLPMSNLGLASQTGTPRISGRELMEQGLPVKLAAAARVIWIAYQRVN